MKIERQTKILELIRENDIETQSELLEKLNAEGFSATQATVSRDIKELRLVKVPSSSGAYKYASETVSEDESQSKPFRKMKANLILISFQQPLPISTMHTLSLSSKQKSAWLRQSVQLSTPPTVQAL